MSAQQKETLLNQVKGADADAEKAEVARAKAALECYYHLKDEIETDLMEKLWPGGGPHGEKNTPLSQTRLAEKENTEANVSKILKAISNLPNKKPSTDKGFVAAARNVEVGKRRRLTPEQREKRKAKAEEAAQEEARGKLFQKKKSDRKTAAEKKRVKQATAKATAAAFQQATHIKAKRVAKKAPAKKSG